MPTTDTFFADVETVIASLETADAARIRLMVVELDKIARDLPRTAARCYTYQARLYSKTGEHQHALRAMEKAIARAPKDVSLYVYRGRILAAAGRHRQAIVDYDRALMADPEMVQALVHRGNAYKALGDTARARADYAAALDLEPGSQPIKDRLRELDQ